VILGVGVGYLEEEFEALGSSFGDRAERTDDAIVAMRQAWTGDTVERAGPGYRATGNTMLPRPVQQPGPPVWVGGNSRRAIRRAVELGDGWSPFPAGAGVAGATGTAALRTADDLARSLEYAAAHAAAVGRTAPLTVVFVPEGLAMTDRGAVDEDRVVASIRELAAVGVDWVTVTLPGDTRDAQLAALDRFTVVADAVAGA
jgi:alkanesulfonate monooxygenase SsuD/methylene tetrahydromethanopterin reductase-like flavin-dependent oxidoreductase (luciferase family)